MKMNYTQNENKETESPVEPIDNMKIEFFPSIFSPHKSNFLKLEDAEIYYEVLGEGPALIFIHGLGGNHLSWWQQVPYFSDRYKCINFSHRGFAHSKNYSNRIGHEVFAEDLSALIEHLNLKDVYIVAQSMGGWTALTYTLSRSENVKAVVMASTSGTIDFRQVESIDLEKLSSWEEWSQKEISELKEEGVLNAIGRKMSERDPFLSYNYEQIYNLTPYSYKEFIRADIKRERIKSPDLLASLQIPFLFITGELDVSFPPIGGKAVASIMPDAQWKTFEETGHSVYFEKANEFNKIVDEFLTSVSGIAFKD